MCDSTIEACFQGKLKVALFNQQPHFANCNRRLFRVMFMQI
jgi:hypothetical protein